MQNVKVGELRYILPLGYNTNPDIISTLLKAGASPNANDGLDERTPLHFAVGYNTSLDTITTLLKAGANPNEKSRDGSTPLHYAAKYSTNPDFITTLLKAGANLKARDRDSKTPLALLKVNKKLSHLYYELTDK